MPFAWLSHLHLGSRAFAVVVLLYLLTPASSQSILPPHLGFLATHNLFERVRADPAFDLRSPANFGYFFEGKAPDRIARLRSQLEQDGYMFVSEHSASAGSIVLQVAKTEIHTVDSLVERNRRLSALAESVGQVVYTGWDIARNTK